MLIKIKFFGDLKKYLHKSGMVIEVPPQSTVRDLIVALSKQTFQSLSEKIISQVDELNPRITILVNGRNMIHLKGLETRLKDHDSISFLPIAGGG